MRFKEVEILEWYDNIITAFCKNEDNSLFYCSLLAMDASNESKVYLCIELEYFVKKNVLINIRNRNKYLEDEQVLKEALEAVKLDNESFLIKTTDLGKNDFDVVKYKSNFDWNRYLSLYEYPISLHKSLLLDNWWAYFNDRTVRT